MIYLYKCDECHSIVESTSRGDALGECVFEDNGELCTGTLRRRFVVNLERPMQEHWNHTVNKPISDPNQFKRELREAGEKYSEKNGIETDYQPLSRDELRGMMTMEGMDSTNRERVKQGLKPIEV